MAFVYPKQDPRDPSVIRWFGRIKLGSKWLTVSLRLNATGKTVGNPGSDRAAVRRLNRLVEDLAEGAVSQESKGWLGSRSLAKIEEAVAGRNPVTWEEALARYSEALTKNIRQPPDGKAPTPTYAPKEIDTLRKFVEFLGQKGRKVIPRRCDPDMKDYLESRDDVSAVTLRNNYVVMLSRFARFLVEQDICEPVDMAAIRGRLPKIEASMLELPGWQQDLAMLTVLHGARQTTPNAWSVWCFWATVRGLGCRPSEATTLLWDTVDLTSGYERVRFLATKNNTHRTSPILYQWVLDAFVEMKDKHGGKGKPVCPAPKGGYWTTPNHANKFLRKVQRSLKMKLIAAKPAQKLGIAAMIRTGFPPHVVAHWTGHTLTIQERHYMREDGYLPSDHKDYGTFETLSRHGVNTLNQLRSNTLE